MDLACEICLNTPFESVAEVDTPNEALVARAAAGEIYKRSKQIRQVKTHLSLTSSLVLRCWWDLIMSLGGAIAISDRRYRFRKPAKKTAEKQEA